MDGDEEAQAAHEVIARHSVKAAAPGEPPELLPEADRRHCPFCDLVHATNAPNCYRCGKRVL